jgi:hypothetical protein
MAEALEQKLKYYIRSIKGKIGDNFLELDALLETEEKQITHFETQYLGISGRLKDIDGVLGV